MIIHVNDVCTNIEYAVTLDSKKASTESCLLEIHVIFNITIYI